MVLGERGVVVVGYFENFGGRLVFRDGLSWFGFFRDVIFVVWVLFGG